MTRQKLVEFVSNLKPCVIATEAIVEAATRPHMRFVPIKQTRHHDMQSWLRVRDRLVRSRTAVLNETHGLIGEYGITLPKSKTKMTKKTPLRFSSSIKNTDIKELIRGQYEDIAVAEARIKKCDSKIREFSRSEEVCERLQTIPGVGEITSVAMVSAVVDPKHFKNGREFSASLGLVPKHTGTGGKTKLGRISKRGD